MQIKKELIKNKIIQVAQYEFTNFGYNKTSMRKIANKCNISLSNIYNYFTNKDELFVYICQPTIDNIKNYFEKNSIDNFDDKYKTSLEFHISEVHIISDFIAKNKDILNLILCKSNGSSLENYGETLIDEYTTSMLEYVTFFSKLNKRKIDMSEFVAHNIAGFWFNFFYECITHELSKSEIEKYCIELMQFMFGGWRNLLLTD